MVIIRMWGGLGNQLFLYALYEKMCSLGRETYIYLDKDSYDYDLNVTGLYRAYQLPLLGLNPEVFPKSEQLRGYLTSRRLYDRVKRRINAEIGRIYYEKENGRFDPSLLSKDNIFVSGYFQTEKYFEDVSEIIRNKIHFEGSEDNAYSDILKEMRKDNSVSVHVRLTDYLQEKNLGGICDADYYKRAIEQIKEKISNPVFYLFSDDLDTAEKILSEHTVIPVRFHRGSKSYLDMFLMSQCKHHIIANSSFSWWGAWLDSGSDKIVIAPKRWANDRGFPDICPESWIRVSNETIS